MLSIDFLAGFTIFLLALIVAAGMVPGMLAGLQSATIDYDGVAYRTSVILAEDPGWWFDDFTMAGNSRWEGETTAMDRVKRMGLAVSKETPNVLSMGKIDAFFDDARYPAEFYRKTVFFSDYPYSYNISLKTQDGSISRTLGDPLPGGDRGYIRRAVMVKESSSATLDFSNPSISTSYTASPPRNTSSFNVSLNISELLASPPAYRIDPFGEQIAITLENLSATQYGTADKSKLSSITLWRWQNPPKSGAVPSPVPRAFPDAKSHLYIDGVENSTTPIDISQNLTLVLDPGYFSSGRAFEGHTMEIRFQFTNSAAANTTVAGTFAYSPSDSNLPPLKPAVLEVAVW